MKNANSKNTMTYKNDTLFDMYKTWCSQGSFKDELNKHQFGMKVNQISKKQLNIKGLVCITKCPSNSKTTIDIDHLIKYFKTINVDFE